jgi:hypothetical protein
MIPSLGYVDTGPPPDNPSAVRSLTAITCHATDPFFERFGRLVHLTLR